MSEKEWLDGAELAEWLHARLGDEGLEQMRTWPRWARAYHRWTHEGGLTSVYTVDEVFNDIGLHLWEIPDGIYRDAPRRRPPRAERFSPEFKAKVVAAWRESRKPQEVGKRYGVSPKTIYNWVRTNA